MKLVSWNVNGLRAVMNKEFVDIFVSLDADIFCLQETKLQKGQIDFSPVGYKSYWNYADKKGYSGTAVFTKIEPLNVTYGLGIDEHDHEGRVITLEFPKFYVINVYVPNSQDELARLDYRAKWEDDFLSYIKRLDAIKPVIYGGDLNVAHEEIDLKNPNTNHQNPGFTDIERKKFTNVLSSGFIDSFRYQNPIKKDAYSWWSYRMRARDRNVGWRIDYWVVSEKLKDKISDTKILNKIMGSDHCPVMVDIKQ